MFVSLLITLFCTGCGMI
ncbi:hypothetical protein LINPERPRIM_LOCUS19036 [Linum perenne]